MLLRRCWPLNSSDGSCCAMCPVQKYVACVFSSPLLSSFFFSLLLCSSLLCVVFFALCFCCSFSCYCCRRRPRCQGHKLTQNKASPDLVQGAGSAGSAVSNFWWTHTHLFSLLFSVFFSFYLLFFIPLSAVTVVVVVVNPHTELDWKCCLAVFLCVLCGKLLNGTDTCPHYHSLPPPPVLPRPFINIYMLCMAVCVSVRRYIFSELSFSS